MKKTAMLHLTCKNCQSEVTTLGYKVIHIDGNRDLREQVISGELFTVRCPQCSKSIRMEYETLYVDLENKVGIAVVHEGEDYPQKLEFAKSLHTYEGEFTRVVKNTDALREKVTCLAYHRDDRVIEIYKALALESLVKAKPELKKAEAYYLLHEGQEVICVFHEQELWVSSFDEKRYEKLNALYQAWPEATKKDAEHFAIVDSKWAFVEKTLLMCWAEERACPNCETEQLWDSVYCPYCGHRLPEHHESSLHREWLNALDRRYNVAKAEAARRKRRKKILLCLLAAVAALFVFDTLRDFRHRNIPRNFVTETMEAGYNNVYAHVTSIEPVYFVYRQPTTKDGIKYGSKTLNSVVCRCTAVNGSQIWAKIFYQDYPGSNYAIRESAYQPLQYPWTQALKLTGRARYLSDIPEEWRSTLQSVLVIDVSDVEAAGQQGGSK